MRLRIDSERRPRELDPVLGIQVPAVVPTLRALTEQFPTTPASQSAFLRLAEAYEDLRQFERAAQALSDLATNFPTNAGEAWFRAGEVYERRLEERRHGRATRLARSRRDRRATATHRESWDGDSRRCHLMSVI